MVPTEDLLAMKGTARSADHQRKHRGPDWTVRAMGKTINPSWLVARNCQNCDLWWWVQKSKHQWRLDKISEQPVIEGDFRSNWSRHMSRRIAVQISQMAIADYKEWSCRYVLNPMGRSYPCGQLSVVRPNVINPQKLVP